MPCPETQYVLDGALECLHIAGDTHHYLMEVARDATDIVDAASARLAARDGRNHWRHLTDLGLELELAYLRWRKANPHEAVAASVAAIGHAPSAFKDISRTWGDTTSRAGMRKLDRRAMSMLDAKYDTTRCLQALRRSLNRAASDIGGWTSRDFDAYRRTRRFANTNVIDLSRLVGDDDDERIRVDKTHARLRKASEREHRSILKRSARLLSKLVGHDATRIFIGGGALRIEGRHAIYEMSKHSSLGNAHGGFKALSVYDRDDPRILLCNLCIYTDDVPLLDHIASLVLHIRGGMEDEILRIGNATVASDTAYERPWLVPHLPPNRPKSGPGSLDDMLARVMPEEGPEQAAERQRMTAVAARRLFRDVFAPHAGLIRAAHPWFGRSGMLRETLDLRRLTEGFDVEEVPAFQPDPLVIRHATEEMLAA